MNYLSRPTRQTCSALCLATVVISVLATSAVAAPGKKKNPTSKIFVTDMQGEADIATDNKIVELTKKSVHSAEGTVIETKSPKDGTDKAKAHSSMVYSNGTGIFFDPGTRLEVRKFVQEPFAPNRSDMETEPSISQTQTRSSMCAASTGPTRSIFASTSKRSATEKTRFSASCSTAFRPVASNTIPTTDITAATRNTTARKPSAHLRGQALRPSPLRV